MDGLLVERSSLPALPLYSCPRCVRRYAALTIEADHGCNNSFISCATVHTIYEYVISLLISRPLWMQSCSLCSSPRFEHLDFMVYIRQRWHPTWMACLSSTAPCQALPLYSCPRCVCRNAAMTIEADHRCNNCDTDP